jgi:HPt (histidine-containing phosphotransfer) domain-containing protein
MTVATRPIVFDKKHALARLGGLEDVLHDVMELMTTECPKSHAGIGAAWGRRDSCELKRCAHTLKGSVSLVGAADLVRRLKRVEDCATAGEFDKAAAEFHEIDVQFFELQSALRRELSSVECSR